MPKTQPISRGLQRLLLGLGLALALGLVGIPLLAWAETAPAWGEDQPPARRTGGPADFAPIEPADTITYYVYLPLVARSETCQPIPGETYSTVPIASVPTDRPAEQHADLNLSMRSYQVTSAYKGLVDYAGGTDPNAPQLSGLFAVQRTPVFTQVYQVYDWNWTCNCRGNLLTSWPVTLAGLAATPGETIHLPNSGYEIYPGYEALVLYASTERITLKYTRDDNVVDGYTVHVENICVEPTLLALYHTQNANGRGDLPALRPGQAFGRARGTEVGVAIRDKGSFLDPRSRKDWWRGW